MSKAMYAWFYFVAAVIVAYYLYKSWGKKSLIGKSLRNMILCGLCAIFSYTLTLISNSYFVMSIGNSLVFMLIDWILFFFLQYTFYLTDSPVFSNKSKNALIIVLGIDNLMLGLNPFCELALSYREVLVNDDSYLIFVKYPWFQFHLAMCYVMFLGAGAIMFRKCMETPVVYKKKYTTVLVSMAVVIGINGVFLALGLKVDVSIILYSFLACVFYFYSFQFAPYGLICDTRKYIFNQMLDPILLFDNENRLMTYNQSAGNFFELKKGMSLSEFCVKNPYLTPNKKKKQDILEVMLECDGVTKWFQIQYQRMTDKKNRYTGTLMVYSEVPAQKRAIEELEYKASHDPLTGLYNRSYVNQCRQNLQASFPMPMSLGVFNMNGLKLINDFYGLDMGDEVLIHMAECLKKSVRIGDYVARLDGDEMLVFMPGTDSTAAEDVLQKAAEQINQSVIRGVHISAEYGQSILTTMEERQEDVIEEARNEMVQKKLMNKESVRSSIMKSLEKSLLESDLETEQHAERTRESAMQLGKKLGLKQKEIGQLGLLATLHDIGKVSIPDDILHKKEKLTEEEWEIMKTHTTKGYEIAMITPDLSRIAKFILCHHERWDGKGYPYGLKKEEIPMLSRVITVVDAYDVMTHDRPYHKAMEMELAIQELKRCSGTQFDPVIVSNFIEMVQEKSLAG